MWDTYCVICGVRIVRTHVSSRPELFSQIYNIVLLLLQPNARTDKMTNGRADGRTEGWMAARIINALMNSPKVCHRLLQWIYFLLCACTMESSLLAP